METYKSLGLEGKVFVRAESTSDTISFFEADGTEYRFEHWQSCCEHVYIESIVGELSDLVGQPINFCEEATRDDPDACELGRWTFYKFATRLGYVDVRWYGSSNGFYGVGVNLTKYNNEGKQ